MQMLARAPSRNGDRAAFDSGISASAANWSYASDLLELRDLAVARTQGAIASIIF